MYLILPLLFFNEEANMLSIKYPYKLETVWDEDKEEFVTPTQPQQIYTFEHSLKSIALWESEYQKPFLVQDKKDTTEWLTYFLMMYRGDKPLPSDFFTPEVCDEFFKYIQQERTATRVKSLGDGRSMIVTSEVIYAYLTISEIPFEVEDWHLSRCLKLIEVTAQLKNPPKKMSKREILEQNRRLNEERRRKFNSKG